LPACIRVEDFEHRSRILRKIRGMYRRTTQDTNGIAARRTASESMAKIHA
jgi:hypothetical protein